MVICPKCGAHAALDNANCRQCGALLPITLSHPVADSVRVVLEGRALDGFDPRVVQAAFARMAKLSDTSAAGLFAGRRTTVKSGIDKLAGDRYLAALLAIGVACQLEAETASVKLPTEPATINLGAAAAAAAPSVAEPAVSDAQTVAISRKHKRMRWAVGVFIALIGIAVLVYMRHTSNAQRADAERVQSIEQMIAGGKSEEAMRTMGNWEAAQLILPGDPRFDGLRLRAGAAVVQTQCTANAGNALKTLTEGRNLAGLIELNNRCGRFVAAIAPALDEMRIEEATHTERFLKSMFKDGAIFSAIDFESMRKNQLHDAPERPLQSGLYWVSVGKDFARIETERVRGETAPNVRIMSVTSRAVMPQADAYYTATSFDTTEEALVKKFPEADCRTMPNPAFRMCSVEREKSDSITFLFHSGELFNINGRVKPGLVN